jgi:hypothetical protein
MTAKLYAFTCGTLTGEFAHLMEGGEGDITVPIPVFLIEHPKGRALFDTGLHRHRLAVAPNRHQMQPAGSLYEANSASRLRYRPLCASNAYSFCTRTLAPLDLGALE